MHDENSEIALPITSAIALPEGSDLTLQEALELDGEIDRHLVECASLLENYLKTGYKLARMKDTRGYGALGYKRWGNYLEGKPYGRTYLSYLLKLGRAGDPATFLERGMTAALAIEYIQRIDYPEKINELIAGTWNDVKDLSPTAAGTLIGQYVEVHSSAFKKPRKKHQRGTQDPESVITTSTPNEPARFLPDTALPALNDGTPPEWEGHFHAEFDRLTLQERARYTLDMRKFLDKVD